jgi:SNF family Na+-dependent transporter
LRCRRPATTVQPGRRGGFVSEGHARDAWGSRLGVILAVAGSAVGLGNFLRFPGLAAKYGGGVFLIPYFISLLLIGIPICWCEWTIGRAGGVRGYNSAPGIFRAVWPSAAGRYVGVLALLIPVTIYMYYVYIEAWCMAYGWYYLTGALDLGPDPARYAEFFEVFVGAREDGLMTAGGLQPAVVFLVLAFLLNFVLIYRGLSKGIETFCTYAMPALIVIAFIVLARVLTLGTPNPAHPEQNVTNGLGFMWNPKVPEGETMWGALANPDMWLQASGQIFFSLSVGFGVILTYASYLKRKDDVVLSGLTATATNEFCEVVLGGLITIPAAFMFLGADPIQRVAGSSIGLGFYTLPVIFDYIPVGRLFGFLWFLLLFLAAITSSLSMLQPAIAFVEEGFDVGRRVSVTVLGMLTAVGSLLVVYFSKDLMALDVMDFWVGQVMIFTLGTITVIVFGWVVGMERGLAEAHQGAAMRIPRAFRFVIKYVSPVYLLLIFVGFLYQNVGDYAAKVLANRAATFTVLFIAVLFAFFTLLVHQAGQRWDAKEAARTRRREVA